MHELGKSNGLDIYCRSFEMSIKRLGLAWVGVWLKKSVSFSTDTKCFNIAYVHLHSPFKGHCFQRLLRRVHTGCLKGFSFLCGRYPGC